MEPSFELGKAQTPATATEANETPVTLKFSTAKKGLKIEWDENGRQEVTGWQLYVGIMAANGGYQWILYNGVDCPAKHVTIPFDMLPRIKIYAQAEGILADSGTILSEVECWSRTF